MRAAVYEQFNTPLTIQKVPDPKPSNSGVVIKVKANGICLSDWHGWVGHDAAISLPHVPGHELAGNVVAVGKEVKQWKVDDRVTAPFACGCGSCPTCHDGNQHLCDNQVQIGFSHWGSFAEYVAVEYADINLVQLPDEIDYTTAATLGCRFVTSFRAIVEQGKVSAGQWVAVHGCGGIGLSAVMIANALGAKVIAIDISNEKLQFARKTGALNTINAKNEENVDEAVKEITGGGAHVSIDALGSPVTCSNSISCLRKQGKHIQVGLLTGDHSYPAIPMGKVISNELEILGSFGMQAYMYSEMLSMIKNGKLCPQNLVEKTVSLEESLDELINMDKFKNIGITVINRF